MKFLQEKIDDLTKEIFKLKDEINIKTNELKTEKEKNVRLNNEISSLRKEIVKIE